MLERLKRTLVESYVGTIALGWLFGETVVHFANIFSTPVAAWAMRKGYRGMTDQPSGPTDVLLQYALPELIKCIAMLAVGYVLLRWLFFKPLNTEPRESPSE